MTRLTFFGFIFVYNALMKTLLLWLLATTLSFGSGVSLQVLGSGGPEIDGRASSSYVLWIDGKARALIDSGSGSMLGFEKSGAKLEDLEAVFISHLHIDHVVDLPSYIKAGYFSRRSQRLPIYGPTGNRSFPSMREFLQLSFGEKGLYRYMSDVLTPQSDSFEIVAHDLQNQNPQHLKFKTFSVDWVSVHHGIVPALAFRFVIGNKSLVISGDTSNTKGTLIGILKNTDLFVAHHAVSEHAHPFALSLHMNPSNIGQLSQKAGVKKLLLSHRMRRTIGKEKKSLKAIRTYYKGKVVFAEDGMKIGL